MKQAPSTPKPPTMADVAAAAGVSRALVSTVFRNVPGASPATRQRVLEAAEGLGYRIDNRARLLRRSDTRMLGVMFRLQDAFSAAVVHDLYLEAEAAGYDLLLSAVLPDHPQRSETAVVNTLLDDRCSALLLIAPQMPGHELEALGARVPTTVVARPLHSTTCDVVRTDDAAVVDLAVDHLRALGHESITHIDGADARGSAERRHAYRQAMTRHGLGSQIDIVAGGYTEAAGVRAATHILQRTQLPTALLTFNDAVAIGALLELRHAAVRVPDQISVIGYDDVAMSALPHIQLTSVGQDARQTARRALACATSRCSDPELPARDAVIPPYLAVRETTSTR